MKTNGSEALLLSLIREGVDTIFGYPGGAIMPVYDSLYKFKDELNHILVRHEQGGIHAAEGYSKVSGEVGVCLATSGPGATNLITGIADAMIDSVPLVCITGQVYKELLGTNAFQEVDIISVSKPITKWNYQVTSAEEIPQIISKAFHIAKSGRPGPVLIDITKNAQFEEIDFYYKRYESVEKLKPKISVEDISKAAFLINNAKKPLMLVGNGVVISGAEDEVLELSEKGNIPVASTLLGLSSYPTKHRLYKGMLGMHGNYGPNVKTNECDVLIAVGMRFDDRVTSDLKTYAKQAKVIHIEIDDNEIGKNIKPHCVIHSDAKEALSKLIPYIENKDNFDWLNSFDEENLKEYEKVQKSEMYPTEGEIKMAEIVNKLSELTNGDAVIVTDVGQHQMVTSRYYQFKEGNSRSNITSGGLGTMGFSLPASIGAKLAKPNKVVISVSGDGGFQMNIQELGTIMQEGIDVKILILNNGYLGMVRQWQEMFFDGRYSFTNMDNPDFTTIAKGYGIESKRISERSEVDEALYEFINSKGSYLLEVIVEKESNVFPMIPTGASVSEIRLV